MAALPHLQMISSERIFSDRYRFEGKNRRGERHSIFKYTLEGEGLFRDRTGEHPVGKGVGFLTEIADPETAYYYPEEATEPWTFIYMAFYGGGVESVIRQLKKRYGGVFSLSPKHPLIRQMLACRHDQKPVQMIMPGWGAGFVWELMRALWGSMEEEGRKDPVPLLIRRAQDLVAEHIEENINATQLAGWLRVSREHLARRFKEETAMTPHEYIVREKMLLACHLLKDTVMSGKEISIRLGYDEPSHFARTFKRAMQVTPARFRLEGALPVA